MPWRDQLRGDSLSWLLEPDTPGVRYLALSATCWTARLLTRN